MGSPVSVIVVNLIILDVQETSLSTAEVKAKFWKMYVDDTCTALSVDKVLKLLDYLNSIEPSICFTLDLELNGSLPFWMCYCNATPMAPS